MKPIAFRMVLLMCMGLLFSFASVHAQDTYSDHSELSDRLQELQKEHRNLTTLRSLAKTPGDRDLWLLTIGEGDRSNHPAIAVIGGVSGSHLLGRELALGFAEKLLARADRPEISALLKSTTFYVFPNMNPDASEQYFRDIKYERTVNDASTNEDRDDRFDEDPYEDLNGDGLITLMRVADETGSWMKLTEDDRLMTEADASKGENGSYHVFTEGRDNDGDGSFNEDGPGGVNINMNFTYDYPYFQPGAGENMASQPETRALMDFLYEEAPNVFSVVSFGPANNLSSALRFNRGAVNKRVITGWYEEDIALNELLSERYNELTDLGPAPEAEGMPGDLFQWAYFHYGRFSFSTPGWWTPEVKDEEGKSISYDHPESQYLAWAEQEGLDAFVSWKSIDHPDFPGKTVEVGGIKPFMPLNPPYAMVDSLSEAHTEFLIELASMKPQVQILNFKTEKVSNNLTRVTADIHNSGTFPTASRLGERTDWVKEVIIKLELSNGLAIVSGDLLETIPSIAGDGTLQKSWLIRGKGSFDLSAGAPNTGISTQSYTIR